MDNDLKSEINKFTLKAHPIVKDFIESGDMEDTLESITEEYNLNEQELSDLKDLVCEILVGMEDPGELLTKIKDIISFTPETAEGLATTIQDVILDTIASQIEKQNNANTSVNEIKSNQPSNNIGQSFEQIILNQTKAMMPARPAGFVPPNLPIQKPATNEVGREGSSNPQITEKKPASSIPATPEKKAIHNYITEPDPYREPIE